MRLTCPHCGFSKDTPHEKFPPGTREVACPRCNQTFPLPDQEEPLAPTGGPERGAAEPPPEAPPEPAPAPGLDEWLETDERPGVAWDHLEKLGLWRALRLTLLGAMFAPIEFFQNMYLRGGYGRPLGFAVIVGSFGLAVQVVWVFLLTKPQVLAQLGPLLGVTAARFNLVILLTLLMTPLLVVLWVYLTAALMHLVLALVRGNHYGFEATFRVAAYSFAALVLLAVPVFGTLVSFFWSVAVRVVGLMRAQETSPGVAVAAVLWPLLLVLLLGGIPWGGPG